MSPALAGGFFTTSATWEALHALYENLMPDDLILHYAELYNYFIIYHKVIVKEIKCKINVMHLGSS